MKKDVFMLELQDLLQCEETLTEDSVLTDMVEWDSLSKMAAMAYFKANFSIAISLDKISEIKTVVDLIELVKEKIED